VPNEDNLAQFTALLAEDIMKMAEKVVPISYAEWLEDRVPSQSLFDMAQETIVRSEDPSALISTPLECLTERTEFVAELLLALANLRSHIYGFGEVPMDSLVSQLFDEDPYPTSVAYVASLMAIEAIKVLTQKEGDHASDPFHGAKDNFFGLEATIFQSAFPLKAPTYTINGVPYTPWDAIHLHVPRTLTFGQLQHILMNQYQAVLNFVCCGATMLYSAIIPSSARKRDAPIMASQKALATPSSTVCNSALLELYVGCEGLDGEDFDNFPNIILHWLP
jgi:hypothetical protein